MTELISNRDLKNITWFAIGFLVANAVWVVLSSQPAHAGEPGIIPNSAQVEVSEAPLYLDERGREIAPPVDYDATDEVSLSGQAKWVDSIDLRSSTDVSAAAARNLEELLTWPTPEPEDAPLKPSQTSNQSSLAPGVRHTLDYSQPSLIRRVAASPFSLAAGGVEAVRFLSSEAHNVARGAVIGVCHAAVGVADLSDRAIDGTLLGAKRGFLAVRTRVEGR